jgi:UDP-2,3-diacylglucosamine pyrophosphatase LpxH
VGKEALSKAVHRLHYGSEHSLLVAKTASLLHGDILPKIKDRYSTICLRAYASERFSVLSSLDLRKLGRKIIVNIETPRREEQPEIEAELAISGICEAITVPPLRMRQSEAFPILCYWHQKLAPSKLLETEAAEFYVEKLGEAGFPGNIDSIVALARRLTAG